MIFSTRVIPLSIVAALTIGSTAARGQDSLESQSNSVRQRCVAIATDLGIRVTLRNAARLRDLRACNESSGAVLSKLWATSDHNAETLNWLVFASANVRDARTMNAAFSVIRDLTRKPVERAAALTVLANYVDASLLGRVQEVDGTTVVNLVSPFHVLTHVEGSQPITEAHRSSITALVEELKTSDRSKDVKEIANLIALHLRQRSR